MSKKSKMKEDAVHSTAQETLKEEHKDSGNEGSKKELQEESQGLLQKNLQESVLEIMDEDLGKKKKFQLSPKVRKRILIIGGSVAGVLLLIYFGFVLFFQSHFTFGTKINGVSCTGKTIEQAEKKILEHVESYEMHITGKEDFEAVISGEDIDLMVVFDEELEKVKKEQNPFGWIASLFGKKEETINNVVRFNEESLAEQFESLTCLNDPNAVEPVNATLTYKKGGFEIVPEQEGTVVDKVAFKEALWNGVTNLEKDFSMEEKKCYKQPALSSNSEELLNAQKTMNGYLGVKVTYSFGSSKEVVDEEKISSWISLNEKAEIVFDQAAVRAYIDTLGDKYNTYGKARSFQTSYNQTIQITQSRYGWRMNREDETLALIEDIKAGESKEKEPLYLSRAAQYGENDIGNTYVEVNLTAQHVFLYKNGELIIDSDCVTGNLSRGHDTPEGIDGITYKDRDTVLRGPGYASPVSYWMPFNGGVGLHDATWRNKFGGDIYKTSGSHGCVNLPLSVAKTVFENVETGTPVIVYSLPGTESQIQATLTPEEQEAAELEGGPVIPETTNPVTPPPAPATAATTAAPTMPAASTASTTTTTRKATTKTTTSSKETSPSSSETESSSSEQGAERSYQMTQAAMRTELERQKTAK